METLCLIVENGIIVNIIVVANEMEIKTFGGYPYYEGAMIGSAYVPPPTIEERVTALEDAIAAGLNLYEGDLGNG